MIRRALLVLILAPLAACAEPALSAVDMAPLEARSATPPIAPGRYCTGTFEAGRAVVAVDEESCTTFIWNPQTRTYTQAARSATTPDPGEFSVVEISPGLAVVQSNVADQDPARYVLAVFVVQGAALTPAMIFAEGWTPEAIVRHPQVTFGMTNEHRYIAAGARSDIGAFLSDVAAGQFRKDLKDGEKVAFIVRDDGAGGAHEPDARQAMDIDGIRSHIKSLIQAAPAG